MVPEEIIGFNVLLHCKRMFIHSSYLLQQVRKHNYWEFKLQDILNVFLMKEEVGSYFYYRVDDLILKYNASVFTFLSRFPA